jgi:hypothetical protein
LIIPSSPSCVQSNIVNPELSSFELVSVLL